MTQIRKTERIFTADGGLSAAALAYELQALHQKLDAIMDHLGLSRGNLAPSMLQDEGVVAVINDVVEGRL